MSNFEIVTRYNKIFFHDENEHFAAKFLLLQKACMKKRKKTKKLGKICSNNKKVK